MAETTLNLSPSLEPFATGVGALCQEWARLEEMICMNLVYMAGIRNHDTGMAIFRSFDFRDQIGALKIATVKKVKNNAGADAIIGCLDYIDNVLRLRRNRYIHDMWFPEAWDGSRPVGRFSYKAKVVKPQAHAARIVKWSDDEDQAIEDLVATVVEVRMHSSYLNGLTNMWQGKGIPQLERLAAKPPRRRFLPPPQEKRHPSGKESKAPQPPPES